PDDDRAAQGDPAGDRLPVDGERAVLRGDERHLRDADGRRARHRARRARRSADPRRVLLPDPRAVRQPRPQAPGTAARRTVSARAIGDRKVRRLGAAGATGGATMIAIVAVLALPLIGAAVLAFVGERPYASRVNVLASLAT